MAETTNIHYLVVSVHPELRVRLIQDWLGRHHSHTPNKAETPHLSKPARFTCCVLSCVNDPCVLQLPRLKTWGSPVKLLAEYRPPCLFLDSASLPLVHALGCWDCFGSFLQAPAFLQHSFDDAPAMSPTRHCGRSYKGKEGSAWLHKDMKLLCDKKTNNKKKHTM